MPETNPSYQDLMEEIKTLRCRLESKDLEIRLLKFKLDKLARRLFGKSSEKLDPKQMELLLSTVEAEAPEGESPASCEETREASGQSEKSPRKRRAGRTERWPEDIEVVEEIIDPLEVTAEPEAWRLIGEEINEQLDFEPARFIKRRLVRRKYVRRSELDAVPVIAPLPEGLIERGIAAPGLLAQIVVGKYCDHLPLYRQEDIFFRRHQVVLSRQNMARWVGEVAFWLRPIYERIRTGVMADGYVQIDETCIRYLSPGHGQTKSGYLWTVKRPGGDVCYHWETGRSQECLEHIVPVDFVGVLQCDAYAVYKSFAQENQSRIRLAGCLAHGRRGFFEAKDQDPKRMGLVLRLIGALYRVEENLREKKAGPRLREAVRAAQSRPVFERLYKVLLLLKGSGRYLPSTGVAKAIHYALSNWEPLGRYLEDGRLEIDNNFVENAIRPTAIGKKNWLFFGDAQAGERSAILYTIIENCRRLGINPFEYLRDVLTRLPRMTNWQISSVTPEAWAKSRKAKPAKEDAA